MNKFNCFNNMLISRYAAFRYAQAMTNSNTENLFNSVYGDKYGVLSSIGTSGLFPASDKTLRVDRATNTSITINPGVAISKNGEIIVNKEAVNISLTLPATGNNIVHVYIKPKVDYRMTGEETIMHGQTYGTIGTLEIDSCEFSIQESLDPDHILLASIYLTTTGMPADIAISGVAIGQASQVVYPDDVPTWTSTALSSMVSSNTDFSAFPYVLFGGREYIGCVSTAWSGRGLYSTNEGVYVEGVNYTALWSPIVDRRQENAIRLDISLPSTELLESGVIALSGNSTSYRHLVMRELLPAPVVPTISASKSDVVWVNSHLAAGYLTNDMVAAYEELTGIQTSIDNAMASINQLRTDISEAAGGDPTLIARLNNELRKQQTVVIDYRTRAANLKSVLSNKTLGSIMGSDIRKFDYVVSLSQSTESSKEKCVQYEAEVEYYVADTPEITNTGAIKRWFYSRRKNVSDTNWNNMTNTFENTDGNLEVRIPVNYGERIKYRVRAIGEYGTVGEYTAWQSYSFSSYRPSHQFMMVSDIYRLMNPDPYQEGLISQELVSLLYSVIGEFRDATNRLAAVENHVSAIMTEV